MKCFNTNNDNYYNIVILNYVVTATQPPAKLNVVPDITQLKKQHTQYTIIHNTNPNQLRIYLKYTASIYNLTLTGSWYCYRFQKPVLRHSRRRAD